MRTKPTIDEFADRQLGAMRRWYGTHWRRWGALIEGRDHLFHFRSEGTRQDFPVVLVVDGQMPAIACEEIITADPSVRKVGDLLTMQLGPNQVLLTVNIQFRRDLDLGQLERAVDRIENRIREKEPMIERIFIEAESFKPARARSS